VSNRVEAEYGFAEMQIVSFADLYAGKIVAALDRQHPRDLYDVRDLLHHEGIDDKLRRAFIVYLISHDHPMAEVLAPQLLDISAEYKRGFEGMVHDPVSLDELLKAREELIAGIVGKMPEPHKRFLVSVKRGEPDWALLDLPGARDLPAVRWKLENLAKLDPKRRAQLLAGLNAALGLKKQ
jgi:Nucleotidyl transferase AbiEii toxin, Type IV TA system